MSEVVVQRKNSEANKVEPSDSRFHNWYRFILSFPPHLVRKYLDEFKLSSSEVVLDPFCGTGTTIVECKLRNIRAVGIEANPVAHFASETKSNWNVDIQGLRECTKKIVQSYKRALKRIGVSDIPLTANTKVKKLLALSDEESKTLISHSISKLPLHKILVLRKCIKKYQKTKYFKYLSIALAEISVSEASNLKFGPEVGVGKIKNDLALAEAWSEKMNAIIEDLNSIKDGLETETNVLLSDARFLSKIIAPNSISAVITSPPYPNEKDYTRTTRLESVILEFYHSKKELQKFKRTLLRSNTRGIYKGDNDDENIGHIQSILKLAEQVETKRIELAKNSGFERLYHKVITLYFGGMAKHLKELQSILKPGALLAYVVGDQASFFQIKIGTAEILREIAVDLGYEYIRTDLFRTRLATKTKEHLREEVLILRWHGRQ